MSQQPPSTPPPNFDALDALAKMNHDEAIAREMAVLKQQLQSESLRMQALSDQTTREAERLARQAKTSRDKMRALSPSSGMRAMPNATAQPDAEPGELQRQGQPGRAAADDEHGRFHDEPPRMYNFTRQRVV